MHLHEANRVRVQIRIGQKDFVWVWSYKNLRRLRRLARNINRPNNPNNIRNNNDDINDNVYSEDEGMSENEDNEDAFLSDGNWNKVHIRKIINVMDLYKISFEGYHELRMTSKSILPPLSKIIKERMKMSHVITSLHHSTVNSFK